VGGALATFFSRFDGEGHRLFFGGLGVGEDFSVWNTNGLSAIFLSG